MNHIIPLSVELSNFGALRYAKFDVSALTLVCGRNNMGKTYATYALFGFLDFWQRGEYAIPVKEEWVETLVRDHRMALPLAEIAAVLPKVLSRAASEYSRPEILAQVFGADRDFFRGASFSISISREGQQAFWQGVTSNSGLAGSYGRGVSAGVSWEIANGELRLVLEHEDSATEEQRAVLLRTRTMGQCLKMAIFNCLLPRATIVCAERTGAVIFQKELDFTRNRIVEMLGEQQAKSISPIRFLNRFSSRYPLPIRRNVDMARDLPEEERSFLVASEDPRCAELLGLFCEIIGGTYKVVKGEMRFIPEGGRQVKLDMVLSSSSVRALMHLGLYLFYQAQEGDMLLVDEPEQNLHPENQRKMARLLARLANLGVRVFVTTHSDYIVRELNALIMLSGGNPFAGEVRKRHGYGAGDTLDSRNVRVYLAERKLIQMPGTIRRSSVNTLTPADIDRRFGIDARTFDETINEMNQIQQELYFPEGESDE